MVAYVKANTRVQCNIYKLSGAVTPLVPLTALSEELWPHKHTLLRRTGMEFLLPENKEKTQQKFETRA